MKNGETTNAGATFTGAAQRNGKVLIGTVMHPAKREHKEVYKETAKLLDRGFQADGKVTPVGELVPPQSAALGRSCPRPAPAGGVVRFHGDPSEGQLAQRDHRFLSTADDSTLSIVRSASPGVMSSSAHRDAIVLFQNVPACSEPAFHSLADDLVPTEHNSWALRISPHGKTESIACCRRRGRSAASAATVCDRSPPPSWKRIVGPLGSSCSTVVTIVSAPDRL